MLSSPIIPHYPVSLPTTTRQALRIQSLRSVVWIPACRRLMITDSISPYCAGIEGATGVASCLIQYSIYLTSFRRREISTRLGAWSRQGRKVSISAAVRRPYPNSDSCSLTPPWRLIDQEMYPVEDCGWKSIQCWLEVHRLSP